MMKEELLENYPVRIELPVVWGEMDAFGHVNNIVYFRYFESCRIAAFDRIGFTASMKESGIGPILASTRCRFRQALIYPDTITVALRMDDLSEDRFTQYYRVISHKTGGLAAEGQALVVCFDYNNNAKAPLPKFIVEAIHALG